mgnify:CR=1 FL=1
MSYLTDASCVTHRTPHASGTRQIPPLTRSNTPQPGHASTRDRYPEALLAHGATPGRYTFWTVLPSRLCPPTALTDG